MDRGYGWRLMLSFVEGNVRRFSCTIVIWEYIRSDYIRIYCTESQTTKMKEVKVIVNKTIRWVWAVPISRP
jgi:hypothetical protein